MRSLVNLQEQARISRIVNRDLIRMRAWSVWNYCYGPEMTALRVSIDCGQLPLWKKLFSKIYTAPNRNQTNQRKRINDD